MLCAMPAELIRKNDCIEFLDANRIANWVNLHASAFAYVSQVTVFQQVGLRSVEAWAEDAMFEYQFQQNEYLTAQICGLREWLLKPKRVARITGPTGLGKTRLGYETFGCAQVGDDKIRQALCGAAAYVDAQMYGTLVLGWVDQMCQLGYGGVIIVDNCPYEWHHQLASIVQRQNSRLNLLTLDYVPEYGQPDILHIELNPEKLRDIVPKILKSVPDLTHLDDAQIERVSNFAQGFPQIAILTAKAGRALEIRHLNSQNGLADRLLWGRNAPDPQAREFVRCLALFSSVGAQGNYKHQLDFIREALCKGVSEYDFNRVTKQFYEKKILQRAGDFIMVTPPPLAVALAAEWLSDAPDDHVLALFPGFEEHKLTNAFCSQLRLLDFSPRAEELSRKLLGPGSPLSVAEVLDSEVGSRIFRALSELNPLAATDCLYRIFSTYSPQQTKSIVTGRRNIIWALEKLCWSIDTFSKAATVLLLFAAGENETYANSATEQFKQLFHVFLSGTKAPPELRLDVIKTGLKSTHPEVRAVCIQALGSALQHGHFSRSSGPEARGTRLPEKDWEPKLCTDIWNYWREVFQLLKDQIFSKGDLASIAAHTLGENTGAFLGNPLLLELEGDFKKLAQSQNGYWPEAREQITSFLSHTKDLPDNAKTALRRWLSYVQPTDLKSRFLDIVSLPGWHHEEAEGGGYVDVSAHQAEAFAEELYKNGVDWDEFIPMLLQGDQRQAWQFGVRCAQLDKDVQGLVTKCLDSLRAIRKENQNPQLLRGILSAIEDKGYVERVLDLVAKDDALVFILVPLTIAIAPTLADFDRVTTQIKLSRLPPNTVYGFGFGSVTKNFDDDAYSARLEDLFKTVPESATAILQLIDAQCFLHPEKTKSYRKLMKSLLLLPEVLSKGRSTRTGYEWQENAKKILSDTSDANWVRELTKVLIAAAKDRLIMPWASDNIHPIISLLLEKHSDIVWPVFLDTFNHTEVGEYYYLIKLLTEGGSSFENHGSPIWNLPSDKLRPWAEANPQVVPGLLHFMALYFVQQSTNGSEEFCWHPHSLILLGIGEVDEVIGCVHANLASFGSSGSRVPYIEKRIVLVNKLHSAGDKRLSHIADTVIGFLMQSLESARKQDEHHAAGIY